MGEYALHSWSGEYPKILDSREIGGNVQHLLKRAIYQGDEGTHWFCNCKEFETALNSQKSGTLSNIANQQPLRCEHIDRIKAETSDYPYTEQEELGFCKCTCGKNGFVDMGKYAENRYPCKECYQNIQKAKNAKDNR